MNYFYKAITYIFFPGTMAIVGACFPYFAYPGRFGPLVSSKHYFIPALLAYLVLPILGVLFLKSRGWVTDLHIYQRGERVLAYLMAILPAAALAFYNMYNRVFWNERFPFIWAISVSVVLCLLLVINIVWIKPSAHMAGTGGFLALTVLEYQFNTFSYWWPVLAAAICTVVYIARLGLSAHSHRELICGFLLGFLVIFVLFWLVVAGPVNRIY